MQAHVTPPVRDVYKRQSVVRADGTVLYSSAFSPDAARPEEDGPLQFHLPDFNRVEQQYRSYAILSSIAQSMDREFITKHNYQFLNVSLWDNDQYLLSLIHICSAPFSPKS